MDRLSPLDASFLELEEADPHASLAAALIAVFEGPPPGYDEFLEAIRGRLPLASRYRQIVRRIPFDLGAPVWVDDPDFELSHHIQHVALPAPGGQQEFCELIENVMAERLDRGRPLWDYWLIEGLAQGRWALLSKLHHCMVDGISATDLYRALLDPTPERGPAVVDNWAPAAPPSTLRLTVDAIGDLLLNPIAQARALRGALRTPGRLARRTVDTLRGLIAFSPAILPADPSSLSGPLGQQRRYRFVTTDLPKIADTAHQFGATVNDVALAAISGGFRELLLSRHEEPAHHVVRSMVPVSVRAPGDEAIQDNRVSMLLAYLPVDVAQPFARLRSVHAQLTTLKASKETEAGETMTELAHFEPFPLFALGERLVFRLPQRLIVTVTTNVPGPRRPVYALGRRALDIYPFVPIATTVRFGVAIMSYCDHMTVAVTGDRDSTADMDLLVDAIGRNLAIYSAPPAKENEHRRGPARHARPRRVAAATSA